MTDYSKIGFPSTHLLYSIAARNLSAGAICGEVADNAFGAAAGNAKNLWVELSAERALFVDDGVGMAEIWKLFELGGHFHDPSKTAMDIGQFGQGAKDAFLSLGWRVRVDSVRNDRYQRCEVDWLSVAKANSPLAWPPRHDGAWLPAKKSPARIRNGGTMITVTGFHRGRRLPTIDALRVSLARLFKPALREGRKIHIKVGNRLAALDTPDMVRIDDRIEASGSIEGMTFALNAGALLEHSPVYNRIFYGFGHRILSEETKLSGESAPPLFTCDVQLGPEWKPHLQTNKLGITAYKEELEAEILLLVRVLWDRTKSLSEEARLETINARLARTMATVLQFRLSGKSHDKATERPMIGQHEGDNPVDPDKPSPGPKSAPTARQSGAEGGAAPKKSAPSGIKFRKLDEMDSRYVVNVVSDENGVEVRLNGTVYAISHAYSKPFKIEALWPVISTGLTEFLLQNPSDLDLLFPRYADVLGVNADDPTEFRSRLYTYLIEQQPRADEARGFEPKPAEIA